METITNIRVDPARLKEARGDRSPSAVAREVGVTRQQIWNYENGHSAPSGDIVARLCRLYGVDIEQLTTVGAGA